MSSDIRQLLAAAQAAEIKGNKPEAIALLRKAAEFYRDHQAANQALRMLRQIRRLEGIDEDGPAAQMPFETEAFVGPRDPKPMIERTPTLADPTIDPWCSFCCRPTAEAGPLVCGPTGSFICAPCVVLAAQLLEGAK